MNIISKYKEKAKLRKESKIPVRLVINSIFDYKDHDLNILKECLNKWTDNRNNDICLRGNGLYYSWMYVNPDNKEKVYFISTNVAELKVHSLEGLINNPKVDANAYMTSGDEKALYLSN